MKAIRLGTNLFVILALLFPTGLAFGKASGAFASPAAGLEMPASPGNATAFETVSSLPDLLASALPAQAPLPQASQALSLTLSGPTQGLINTSYAFTSTVEVAATAAVTYTWAASEQSTLTHTNGLSDSVSFVWEVEGIKTVTVTAATSSTFATTAHTITLYTPVDANFAAAPGEGELSLMVTFENLSTGSFTDSLWDFGDTFTSTLPNPSHTYESAGVYTPTLTVSGPGGIDSASQVITLTEPVTVPTMVYLPLLARDLSQTYSVSGQVTDGEGNPVEGVTIMAQGGENTTSEADGNYYLLGLTEGLHTIQAGKEGYTCAPAEYIISVPPNETRKNFTCSTETYSISGQITDLDGHPVADVTLSDGAGHFAISGADGSFTFEGLPAGSYTIAPAEGEYLYYPSASTIQVGESAQQRGADTAITFTALAIPWVTQSLGAAASLGTDFPAGNHSIQFSESGYPHIAYGGVNLYYARYDGGAWQVQQVDADTNVGSYPSLAIGSNGLPHIAYYDADNGNLRYASASRAGQNLVWDVDTVESRGNVGKYTAIALDNKNRPHIVYFDESDDELHYAFWDGDDWVLEVIDDSAITGLYPSIAFNSGWFPRVSYYNQTDGNLRYAIRFGDDNWVAMTVESIGDVGKYTSLAVDSYDLPHIAYFDETDDQVRMAYYNGYSWEFDTVDDDGAVGSYLSMVLDRDNVPHLSYYDQEKGNLKYAFEADGEYKVQVIDAAGDVGRFSSLALDNAGSPHFLYYDAGTGDLKYTYQNKWEVQSIGLPAGVANLSNRALKVDSNGLPHFVFGNTTLYHAYFDGNLWQFELVDSSASVGQYASLALDSDDAPHISYYDATNGALKYAFWDQGSLTWEVDTIDNSGSDDVGLYTSIILDSGDDPHIAYFDESNDQLMYAFLDDGDWETEVVDSRGAVGAYASIALGLSNTPRISYYDIDNENLKYAVRLGSDDWATTVVDYVGDLGLHTSLAIDRYGLPHISYFVDNIVDDAHDDLRYAYFDGYSWYVETVDSLDSVGVDTSLAVDRRANPHIAYYENTNGNLKYAYWDGEHWVVEVVDSVNDVGRMASIVLDRNSQPRFLYYDATAANLKYATVNRWDIQSIGLPVALTQPGNRSFQVDSSGLPHVVFGGSQLIYATFDGNLWQFETVDPGPGVGGYAALSLDSKNRPHVSYYDSTNGDLKYARRAITGWLVQTVDDEDEVGLYTSLVIDEDDLPHIAYFDETNDELRYAHFTGGGWLLETVDSGGSVGTYPSIALNLSGIPRISYFDLDRQDLRYAVRLGGDNWSDVAIATSGDVGLMNSLAIDPWGYPHIAYFDDDTDDLKYVYFDGYNWRYYTVDTNNSTGWYISLGIDSDGDPHMSYYDYSNGNLKYARWSHGDWVIEIVDAPGDVGQYTALDLDPADRPHIMYYDATNGTLKYARGLDPVLP